VQPDQPTPTPTTNNANGELRCPDGKLARLEQTHPFSHLVKCQLEKGDKCEKQTDIGGEMFCRIFFYG
jgi:hypothetical protein